MPRYLVLGDPLSLQAKLIRVVVRSIRSLPARSYAGLDVLVRAGSGNHASPAQMSVGELAQGFPGPACPFACLLRNALAFLAPVGVAGG